MTSKSIALAAAERILELLTLKKRVTVAIDGRCCAGKTTLAAELEKLLPQCSVFHADDFFLRPEQRTPDRLAQPGGNMDRERLFSEVTASLEKGGEFYYRPFDCKAMALGAPIRAVPSQVNIIEGSYCCHPDISGAYDLKIFLTTSSEIQRERIKLRAGSRELLDRFLNEWIPLEERYISGLLPKDLSLAFDMIFET